MREMVVVRDKRKVTNLQWLTEMENDGRKKRDMSKNINFEEEHMEEVDL